MRNMKNSILEEPLIHVSIWIINDVVMNEEDDEVEGVTPKSRHVDPCVNPLLIPKFPSTKVD